MRAITIVQSVLVPVQYNYVLPPTDTNHPSLEGFAACGGMQQSAANLISYLALFVLCDEVTTYQTTTLV